MKLLTTAAALAAALSAMAGPARADEFERVPPVAHRATAAECGECHMAFQPALLPAAAWARIMDGLADHFGEDASLAPDLAAEIRAYLTANAGRGDPKILRITEQRWWLHEHRKVAAQTWSRPAVRAKSNCAACHADAERGLYEDDD